MNATASVPTWARRPRHLLPVAIAAAVAAIPLIHAADTKAAPASQATGASRPPTSPAATNAFAATASKDAKTADFATLGFDKLASFKYEVPEDARKDSDPAKSDEQIPPTVKAFNGKRIALKGFMLPLKVEGGLVTELLIMRDQSMCCFGSVPKINEWVSVKMASKGVKPIMDQAITMYGTLKVGGIYENDYLVGIYAMDGEKMDGPGL